MAGRLHTPIFINGWLNIGLGFLGLAFVGLALVKQANARPPVIEAAVVGDRDSLTQLLSANPELAEVIDVDGTSALHWAVRRDDIDAIKALLAAGADPVLADAQGVQPLYLAALNGSALALDVLITAGADPQVFASDGETMLMTAARTGRLDAISLLLEHGAAIDARDQTYAQTALLIAAREGHNDAVALLLEHGADINAQTRVGETPQFVPPCKGTGCGSEGVGINRGGLPDRGRRAATPGAMTALLYAVRDGHDDVVATLIDAGADVDLAEANGIAPLLISSLNNRLASGRLLLAAGADPNQSDFWGRTPLWAAVEYRNLDMNNREQDDPVHNGVDRAPLLKYIGELIAAGADVNARTRDVWPPRRWLYSLNDVSWVDFTGQTAFLRAALSADTSAMQLLLDNGADPNIATFAGTTPLMAAAGVNWVVAQTYTESPAQQLAAVQLCLSLGADINAVNSMGLSALLGAVNRGSNHIIEYLAANGADLNVVDVEGRDAIRWAEGVFLAAVGAERKPATIELIQRLQAAQTASEGNAFGETE